VRARVTREEALLEEKRKDGRERWKNFYLLLVLYVLFKREKIKVQAKKRGQGSSKFFFDLKVLLLIRNKNYG
jgi:hypothetical protein